MVRYTLEQRVFLYDSYVNTDLLGSVGDISIKFRDERVLTEGKLNGAGARLDHTPRKSLKRQLKRLECQSLVQGWQHNCWSHTVKVRVWSAVSARRNVVSVFFFK
jgi:hypothetical protein